MQLALKVVTDFEVRIRDNPLELLKEVEQLTHILRKASYLVLTLVEMLSRFLALRQGQKEDLLSYLKRFKFKRNVVLDLLGKNIRTHAEHR